MTPDTVKTAQEKIDSEEFFDLMQAYRMASVLDQDKVTERYNAVQEFILAAMESPAPPALNNSGQWISVVDAPLFINTEFGWECTEAGNGEFWAAVPYNDSTKPDKKDLCWIHRCVVEDGVGLCIVGDEENTPAGWQLEDVVFYMPIKLPPLPEPPKK